MSESTTDRNPDRLFPMEPTARAIARDLYESVRELPIVSPHGHVPAAMIREDQSFADPSDLFLSSDHYVTRLLHASGVQYDALNVGAGRSAGRDGWRQLAEHWHEFAGTASGYWLEDTFANVFGIGEDLTPESADRIYDALEARLGEAAFSPRALFDKFRIDVLATTDDPLDDLDDHAALRADPGFAGRVCRRSAPIDTSTRKHRDSAIPSRPSSRAPDRRGCRSMRTSSTRVATASLHRARCRVSGSWHRGPRDG